MKLFKHITFIFFFIFFLINKTHAIIPAQCYDFLEQYKDLKFDRNLLQTPQDEFIDFGFGFSYDQSIEADLETTDWTSEIRRTNNFPVITYFSTYEAYKLFRHGDLLISIDGADTSQMDDQTIKNLIFSPDKNQTYEFVILRDKKRILHKIKPQTYDRGYMILDFELISINKIDVINSTVTLNAYIGSSYDYYKEAFPQLHDLAKKTILNVKEDGSSTSSECYELNEEITKFSRIPNPIKVLGFNNLVEENKNLKDEFIDIVPLRDGDKIFIRISGTSVGTWKIKNNFNLSSFPFDKQKIKISVIGENINETTLEFSDIFYRILDFTKKNISVPGWDVKDIKMTQSNSNIKNIVYSDLSYEIDIERQYFYYIFKIILPIILILSICWSSVWLHGREVESKLTITIVCLLSLIAYNFVIDNEIPKLNYLTIMDLIILLSYVYAAIPNILAIITFQFGLNTKYRKFNLKIVDYSKKFGLVSYIIFILIIIIASASNVPDNTIKSLSWAMVR